MEPHSTLKALDDDLREWRINGMNGSPEERAKFLTSCFHGARFNMRAALLATPLLRPGKTQWEVFQEIIPKLIENVAAQGRSSGYTEEQNRLYVDAHERAYRALAGEFGFEDLSPEEFNSLETF